MTADCLCTNTPIKSGGVKLVAEQRYNYGNSKIKTV